MLFNSHLDLEGKHAFLSASKYSWVNYDDEKLLAVYRAALVSARGTELHKFAHDAIRLGIKLPRSPKTLNMYINDAIGHRMNTEQVLYYSPNCFGTTDAISFRQDFLRIHDLKTGVSPTSFHQLEIYAALFCLEYQFKPSEIEIELRIYQEDDVIILIPDLDDLVHIIDKVIVFDKYIELVKAEGEPW